MRRSLLAAGSIWWISATGPAAAQTADTVVLSLARAEALAVENHPFVAGARAELGLAEARRAAAAHSRWAPELSLRSVVGPIPDARGVVTETGVLVSPDTLNAIRNLGVFTDANLRLVQPLYTFGRLGSLVGAAEAGVNASQAGVRATTDEVRLQVRKLYWGMVLGEELLRLADEVLGEIAEAEPQLDERYEDGSVSQNDLFEFEIYKYRARKSRREAADGLEMARAALRAALGLAGDVPVRAEIEGLAPIGIDPGELTGYLTMARESRPELAALEAGVAARRALARSRRAEYYPQLFFAGEVRWNYAPGRYDPRNPFVYNQTNFFRPGFVIGFEWNANLFQTKDRVRMAEREAAQLDAQLAPLTEKVALDVREAHARLVRAAADVEESGEALTAAENWFRAESQTFDLGIGEISDLVDAFQAKIEMETEHLRSTFAFNTALADLSRAVGRDLYPSRDDR